MTEPSDMLAFIEAGARRRDQRRHFLKLAGGAAAAAGALTMLSACDDDDDSDFGTWDDDVEDRPGANDTDMASDLRPGRSSQNLPLLAGDKQGDYDEESAPTHNRPSRFRERDSEALAKQATKKRYTYAACFLVVSLISFAVQTETAVYIQHNLGWKKAYCMLYVES